MYILDTQNIFNFAVEATGRQNLFTVKSDVVILYSLSDHFLIKNVKRYSIFVLQTG
jgi:hypothetical protein